MINRKNFLISISEDVIDPDPGAKTFDVAFTHKNRPSHREVLSLLQDHFGDWVVTVVPL